MPEVIRKAAAWLGLVSDDRAYEDSAVVEFSEPVYEAGDERSVVALSSTNGSRSVKTASAPGVAAAADLTRIITVHPRNYNEARTIGEHYRDGVPVIMNLSEMDDADAKRLVDFAAGLIFGLRGTIERVTNKVFLLSPQNVNVTAEDKERIAGGFYNQS